MSGAVAGLCRGAVPDARATAAARSATAAQNELTTSAADAMSSFLERLQNVVPWRLGSVVHRGLAESGKVHSHRSKCASQSSCSDRIVRSAMPAWMSRTAYPGQPRQTEARGHSNARPAGRVDGKAGAALGAVSPSLVAKLASGVHPRDRRASSVSCPPRRATCCSGTKCRRTVKAGPSGVRSDAGVRVCRD